MKSLIAILSVAIILLFFAVDLYAQEKKDDKKWEISGYFGLGSTSTGSPLFIICPFLLADKMPVLSYGMGVEYFLTPRISLDGEINYLPQLGEGDGMDEQNYRLLGDINLLFYFDLTQIKRPTKLILIVGTGFQYDHSEGTYVSLTTMEQYKYGYGNFGFQGVNFGAGLKVRIKGDWSLRILTKIHRPAGEETQTDRFAVGISYRF